MKKSHPDGTLEEATLSFAGEKTARPEGVVVRVLDPAAPASFSLARGYCRIGKAKTCELVIDRPTVSREHAELALVEGGVMVKDLASRNGTFYLGQRVNQITLAPGSRIEIGGVAVAIEPETDGELAELEYTQDHYGELIGPSAPMRRFFGMLKRLEGSLATVLIEGESGTGKEVIARSIHAASRVAKAPFLTFDCGSVPSELIASELFGHKKGAFTGAVEAHRGLFEAADGGTIFLDEIGELPAKLQPALLRVLELGEVRPVGSEQPRRVHVRVLAATNRDLEERVREGHFREDLFFRLAVVRLHVPPLRERREDVEPIARHLARAVGIDPLPGAVVEDLKSRPWQGNVRELRNAIQAYAALGVLPRENRSKPATLNLALHETIDPRRPYAEQKDALVDAFTAAYVELLLERTGGNQSLAARLAGLDRGYFGRLAARHGKKHR